MDERVLRALAQMADVEEYKAAYADHPTESGVCGYRGCRLSLAEHHRLAFGIMNENAELRRRIAVLERGSR